MFNISATELLVIAVVALLVLGPEKLPDAMRKLGRATKELRRISSGFEAELRDAFNENVEAPAPKQAAAAAPAPAPAPAPTVAENPTAVDPPAAEALPSEPSGDPPSPGETAA